MAVTKQTYSVTATWTPSQLADIFRSAFIDAGLMTEWHDSTSNSWYQIRVLKLDYDNTKTYGSCYYIFLFATDWSGYSISSGWNSTTKTQAGTQFLDFHVPIASLSDIGSLSHGTRFEVSTSSLVGTFLHRYTSNADSRQSWFVLQRGTNTSRPFSILHPQSNLYAWLDLNKGIVDPYCEAHPTVSANAGFVSFQMMENVRRCLMKGHAVNGQNTTAGSQVFHYTFQRVFTYSGAGSALNTGNNWSNVYQSSNGSFPLPVGIASANPAYSSDYIPVCSGLPWSAYTSDALASDFGVYMHYANNTIGFQDKFIVQAGVEEWETLAFANNATVSTGASPAFLARVV